MELITSIIIIVFAVLQIILFFKVWGMTNDVSELKETLLFEIQKKGNYSNPCNNSIQF